MIPILHLYFPGDWAIMEAMKHKWIGAWAIQFAEAMAAGLLAALRHGCGLPVKAVARLTGMSSTQVRDELGRFEARCRRGLSGQDRARAEQLIARRMKRLLTQEGPGIPQPSQVYRAFEAEADGAQVTGHRVSRVVGHALMALLAVACAGLFWLFAVLIQSAP